MKVYLDTEFNGHGGELLSLALVPAGGSATWYGVWALPARVDPWVRVNVVPKLNVNEPMYGTHDELRTQLHLFLHRIDDGDLHIYADWPADFEYFTRLLRGPAYDSAFYRPMSMHILVTPDGEPRPTVPHNAFSDAMALMEWHKRL